MCVQLEDYSRVRDSVQAYVSGDVRVWIGTQYTMYGLYEVIPQVGWQGPSPCQVLTSAQPFSLLVSGQMCSVFPSRGL